MSKKFDQKLLFQRWIHSREEDTPTEIIYRPSSFPFPPARGRDGFELRPDHTAVDVGISAADGATEYLGQWHMCGPDKLEVITGPEGEHGRKIRVLAVEANRLVVERETDRPSEA